MKLKLFIIQGCTCLLAHFVNNMSYCISYLFSNYILAVTFELLSSIKHSTKQNNPIYNKRQKLKSCCFYSFDYTDIIDWISSDNIIVECSVLIYFVWRTSQVLYFWLRTLNHRVILIHVQLIDLLRSIYLTLPSR